MFYPIDNTAQNKIMLQIDILIVEDDLKYSIEIETMIRELGFSQISQVNTIEQAELLMQTKTIACVVCNTSGLVKKNSLDFLETLDGNHISTILFSAKEDELFFEKIKKYSPDAYLVKPINKYTFQNSLLQIVKRLAQEQSSTEQNNDANYTINDFLFIRNNNFLSKILIRDILYISTDGNYSVLHTLKKRHIVKISLVNLKASFDQKQILQVHRNYVVNIAHVDNINLTNNELSIGGNNIPIGRTYKELLLGDLKMLK